jgi:hypothetical protein
LRIIETHDPDRWEARSEHRGCLLLFGLPFFLAGLAVVLMAVGIIPTDNEPQFYVRLIMLLLFGPVFMGVGLVLMTGRTGIIIDRQLGTVTSWKGLLVPMKRDRRELQYYDRILLDKDIDSSGDSSTTVFPVILRGGSMAKPVEFERSSNYNEARELAENLAKFLEFPLEDRSSGKKIVRDSDKLDESIRDRAQRTGETIDMPAMPYNIRSKVNEQFGRVDIEIPAPPLQPMDFLGLVFSLVFVGIVLIWFVRPILSLPMPKEIRYVFLGFLGIFFIFLPIGTSLKRTFAKSKSSTTITATRDMLTVTEKGLGKTKTASISADQLEELTVGKGKTLESIQKLPDGSMEIDRKEIGYKKQLRPQDYGMSGPGHVRVGPTLTKIVEILGRFAPGPVITARSDKETIEFGRGLSQEELDYIHAVINKVITE